MMLAVTLMVFKQSTNRASTARCIHHFPQHVYCGDGTSKSCVSIVFASGGFQTIRAAYRTWEYYLPCYPGFLLSLYHYHYYTIVFTVEGGDLNGLAHVQSVRPACPRAVIAEFPLFAAATLDKTYAINL